MPSNPSQVSSGRETFGPRESSALKSVLSKNRMSQVRREIGIIADRSYRDHLINDEAYQGYRELAEGREAHALSADMLESTRSFAKKHELKAVRVHQKIEAAMREGYASEADEEFLMENLVTDNIEFAMKAEQVEGIIEAKLARMKADRQTYDKLVAHPLIQNIGYLKVDATTKIGFPDAKEFMEMTVPERREMLAKIQEALPKAEQFASQTEAIEDTKLTQDYRRKLDSALERRVIGKVTYQKFLDGFQKVDHDEKKYWLEEFDAQMERYGTLWTQIRSELKGPALASMEGKLNQMGYSELFAEFGKAKELESKKLSTSYVSELESYREKGVIGRHTLGQFVVWMNQQDLASQYEALGQLPDQMARYEKLWDDVKTLSPKDQRSLKSKIDVWGYTELNQEYRKLAGLPLQDAQANKMEEALSQIKSAEIREAIIETDEILSDQGAEKKKTFTSLLDKMFSRATQSSFDATSFETQIRERVSENNSEVERSTKSREASDEVNLTQIQEDADMLEDNGKAEVIKDNGFLQVESEDQKGDVQRDIQVTVNEEDGMKRFLSENGRHHYQAENDGGKDDLSLAIQAGSGRTVELDLQEIRALQKYLKLSEQDKSEDQAA